MDTAVHDDSLATLAGRVASLLAIGEAWPLEQRVVLDHLKEAIEALLREARTLFERHGMDEAAAMVAEAMAGIDAPAADFAASRVPATRSPQPDTESPR